MTIDYPKPEQIPALKSLWKTAFGDSDEFLSPFFEIAYSPDRCRCITLEGALAAALYWFETSCGGQRFAYVYAVATDPAFRNRGLCARLMEDTAELLKEQGFDGILLYPASEGLSRMYGKMGYVRCTTVREFLCNTPAEPVPMRKIGKAEYAELRRKMLPPGGAVQEGALLDFLDCIAGFYAGDNWVALISCENDEFRCLELLGDVSAAPGILGAFGKKEGFFRTFGADKPFVMGLPMTDRCELPQYFGLPLD